LRSLHYRGRWRRPAAPLSQDVRRFGAVHEPDGVDRERTAALLQATPTARRQASLSFAHQWKKENERGSRALLLALAGEGYEDLAPQVLVGVGWGHLPFPTPPSPPTTTPRRSSGRGATGTSSCRAGTPAADRSACRRSAPCPSPARASWKPLEAGRSSTRSRPYRGRSC